MWGRPPCNRDGDGAFRHNMATAALAFALGACGSQTPPTPVAEGPSAEPVIEVETVRIRRGAILERISAPGSLVARRESRIGAEVRGRIERVFVAEGDRVEAGDPLFQIDRVSYEVLLRQAEAGLDLARSELRQLEADFERARALHGKDIVSQEEIDHLETGVAVARARQRQAREVVALARRNLDQTLVRAPFAGSIARRLADEGTSALVQPQTIVVVLQETAELEARATIPESQLAVVRLGDPVLLHVEGLPLPIQTEVSAVSDTIDPATRTYRVKMRVPNPDYVLKAGVFARVEILPQAKRDVILLPREAIRSNDGRTTVLTVRDGRAVAVPVLLGLVSQENAEVLRGLRVDGEVIVGEAAHDLASGMPVRVVNRPGESGQ